MLTGVMALGPCATGPAVSFMRHGAGGRAAESLGRTTGAKKPAPVKGRAQIAEQTGGYSGR